jgi:DNA modification methylase
MIEIKEILNKIIQGNTLDVLKQIPSDSIDCVITSPPYWGLRDYGVDGQIGLEKTPEEYVTKLTEIFREVKRVLKKEGTLWLNLGDSYSGSGKGGNPEDSPWSGFVGNKDREKSAQASKPIIPIGLKPKDLIGIPWRVAFALQADKWYLRQDIIWSKPNPMPESVTDRCTKSHEYIFLLSKNLKYHFDNESIKEKAETESHKMGGKQTSPDRNDGNRQDIIIGDGRRNKRSVWHISTNSFPEAHFATFPEDLIEPMIKAGCPKEGIVLDPFIGSGTTGLVARKLLRNWIGIELNPNYVEMAKKRLNNIPKRLDGFVKND